MSLIKACKSAIRTIFFWIVNIGNIGIIVIFAFNLGTIVFCVCVCVCVCVLY